MIWIFLVAFALFTGVEGLYEGIDDITNNLATDLAPLITLFGEQATKQFLSESTSFMDSIIFSIAPLGLITAIVSVIRIYGSPSFKSIIGRSQEAHGVAEAELCSSTSQDVCELWSNGGICRVFGRPKILDFIYNTDVKDDFYPLYRKDRRQDIVEDEPFCGIYRPLSISRDSEVSRMGLSGSGWEEVESSQWISPKLSRLLSSKLPKLFNLLSRLMGIPLIKPNDSNTIKEEPSANPNLALNIGIRKLHGGIHCAVLVLSVLLELSFFVFAAWTTFYDRSSLASSSQAKLWFGFTILGTIMLLFGMILCARLIDLKSRERRFKRTGGTSTIFWLQPGGQCIGDQLFHSFAFSESKNEYITSARVNYTEPEPLLYPAVILTTFGWALQFIGLRGSPGSIALFQFIATLIMSILRAFLRRGRFETKNNRLGHENDLIEGHELDWQAMNIDQPSVTEWHVSDYFPTDDWVDIEENIPEGVSVIAATNFRAYYTLDDDRITHAANCASDWMAAQEAQGPPGLRRTQSNPHCAAYLNPAAKIMRLRSRLAKLTSVQSGLPPEQAWGGEVRTTALQLQKALQTSAEYLFTHFPLDQAWKGNSAPEAIAWKSSCRLSRLPYQTSEDEHLPGVEQQETEDHFTIGFQMYNRDGKWSISSHQLEAVLGLWSWSLKRSELLVDPTAEEHLTRSKMIVVEKSKREDFEAALYLWVTQTRQVREYGVVDGISRPDNLSLPTSSLLSRAQSPKQSSGAHRQGCTPNTGEFTVLGIPTNGSTSLLQLMAQDVYTIFIHRIVDIVGDLRNVGDQDDLNAQYNSFSTDSRVTPWLGLSNPHIDALARALVSAGFATREEALMSIVPAFLCKMKLRFMEEDIVQNVLDWCKSLRRDFRFRDGASLITRMLSRCPVRFRKQGVRCLGDLYRRAALSKRSADNEFGLSGMRHIKKRLSAFASDREAQDILSCYEQVSLFFSERSAPKTTYRNSDAEEYIQSEMSRLEPSSEQITRASTGRELLFALIFNERFYLPSGEDSEQLHEILSWAIRGNFPELIEDIWTTARSPEKLGRDESSLLATALEQECELETFHSLLDWPGMDVNGQLPDYEIGERSRTPLVLAIKANRSDLVCSILRRGAHLNRRDHLGMTPLHHAFRVSNKGIIRLLLDRGAVIHRTDAGDRTALHLAAEANSEAVIQWLLDEGGNIHEKDQIGRTALHAASRTNSEAVVRLLLDNGAGAHEKDAKGRTALHFAAKGNDEAVVRLLLENGAQMQEKDERGRTALHIAARHSRQGVLRQLLDHGNRNGLVDHHDWSSLWSVIPEWDIEVSKLLEEMGIEKPLDVGKEEEVEEEKDYEQEGDKRTSGEMKIR